MGTRTYSRRGANGQRILTAAGRVKFNQMTGLAQGETVSSESFKAIAKIDAEISKLLEKQVNDVIRETTGRIIGNELMSQEEYYRRLYGGDDEKDFVPTKSDPEVWGSTGELDKRTPIPEQVYDSQVGMLLGSDKYEQMQKDLYRQVSNLSAQEQQELLNTATSSNLVIALGLFGTPKIRRAALEKAKTMESEYSDKIVTNGTHTIRIVFGQTPKSPYQQIANELPEAYANEGYERFVQDVFSRGAANTPNGLFARYLNQAIGRIGPNVSAPNVVGFGAGIKAPEPSPIVVRYLRQLYRETQEKMKESTVTLYRAGGLGNNIESWSSLESVARSFAENNPDSYRYTYEAQIPKEYILFSHVTRPKVFQGWGEAEYLVLGSAALQDVGVLSLGRER